jgi:hypothetical protein
MKKIRLDEMDVLVSLEWTPLPLDVPERKGLRDFLAMEQNKGIKRGVILRARGVSVVGTPAVHVSSDFEPGSSAPSSAPKQKSGGFRDTLAKFGPTTSKPKSSGSASIGSLKDIKPPSGVPSACALLALANQRVMKTNGTLTTGSSTSEDLRWIVAQQIFGQTTDDGEDLFWLGVVMNGVPLPDGDIVAGRQKVVDEILEILATSSNFVVHTTDKDIRYNVMSQVDVIDRTFQDLVRGIPSKEAELTIFSLNTILTIGIVALLIILGVGWWAYSSWANQRAVEAARVAQMVKTKEHAAEILKASQKYTADVKVAVAKGLDDAMEEVIQDLAAPSPKTVLDSWIKLIYKIDLDQSGWNMTEIDCALDGNQPTCTVNLDRATFGVNRILLQDHPDAVINADKATYVVRAPEVAHRSSPLTSLVAPMDFQVGLLSDMELLRGLEIQHIASASADINKSVVLPPKPSVLASAQAASGQKVTEPSPSVIIKTGAAQGDLKVSGNQLWMLSGLGPLMDQPIIAPKTLVLTVNTGLEKMGWNLDASYLLRTLPQPVVPAIPIDETTRIVFPIPEKYRLDPSAPVSVSTGVTTVTGPATSASVTQAPQATTAPSAPASH